MYTINVASLSISINTDGFHLLDKQQMDALYTQAQAIMPSTAASMLCVAVDECFNNITILRYDDILNFNNFYATTVQRIKTTYWKNVKEYQQDGMYAISANYLGMLEQTLFFIQHEASVYEITASAKTLETMEEVIKRMSVKVAAMA